MGLLLHIKHRTYQYCAWETAQEQALCPLIPALLLHLHDDGPEVFHLLLVCFVAAAPLHNGLTSLLAASFKTFNSADLPPEVA